MEEKEALIYEAETRYKYKVNENQLTSRVFGALAMLPRDIVLLPFLKKLAKDTRPPSERDVVLAEIEPWKPEDVETAEITLWEGIDEKRPDVCITTRNILILIEAKTDSDPDKDEQLKPQFIEGYKRARQTKRKFAYFLVTRDDQRPVARDTEKELKKRFQDARVHWRSWTQVWQWLREIRKDLQEKTHIDNTSLNLLDATVKLLEARHMKIKGPTGFKREWFSDESISAFDKVEELYYTLYHTIPHIAERAEERGIVLLREDVYKRQYKHEPNKYKQLKTQTSIPYCFEYYFKDNKWKKVQDPWKQPLLLLSFSLETGSGGISVSLYWAHPSEEVEAVKNETKELIKTRGERGFHIDQDDSGFYVSHEPDFEQLKEGEQAVETLVEELDNMRKFANDLESLRQALRARTPRKRG